MALTNLSQITTSGISTLADVNVNNITGVAATFTGNVTVGGTLTYDDVTNIDSVGLITARSGLSITSGDLTLPDAIVHSGDTNTKIRFPAADTVTVETSGSERLRIDSDGHVKSRVANLAVSNDSATFQVLTTESQAADFGGTLGLGGVYHATNQLSFANIAGKKENSTTGNGLGYLAIATRGGSGMAERLRITSGGSVGIGNTASSNIKLDVRGSLRAKAAAYAAPTNGTD